MNERLCLLVVVVPEALEDRLIDELLLHPHWVTGFDSQPVEGHGSRLARHSAAERVRGRARRTRLEMVMAPGHARALLDHLRAVLPQPDVVYWTQTLEDFGRLA